MARKLVIGIFISILAIIAMSHNVSAIQPVINLNNYELVHSSYAQYISCEFINMVNTTTSGNNYCTGQVSNAQTISGLTYIYTTNTFSTKKNDILTFYLLVSLESGSSESELRLSNMTNQSLGWNIVDWKVVDSGKIHDRLISTGGYINQQGVNYDLNVDFYSGFQYFKLYEISLISINDGNKNFGLITSSGNTIFQININDAYGSRWRFKLSDFKLYRFAGDEANKEVQEKTQEAVDESAQSGESSQSSVEGSTQNLMSAGASIISALSSAPATDCNINMTTSGSSSAFTGAIGSVNLCSGVPSGVLTMVQGIVALVFTPIVLYYTYSIITTIYKQFREYNS